MKIMFVTGETYNLSVTHMTCDTICDTLAQKDQKWQKKRTNLTTKELNM
jgi:hypothetical protein